MPGAQASAAANQACADRCRHEPATKTGPLLQALLQDQEVTPRGQQNGDRRFRWSPLRQPGDGLVARGGVEPPTFRFSGGRSYQLSYLARCCLAVLTGLEPATSALTGRRALQLLHRTLLQAGYFTVRRAVPPTGFEPVLPP